jgi:hypothetical protein
MYVLKVKKNNPSYGKKKEKKNDIAHVDIHYHLMCRITLSLILGYEGSDEEILNRPNF